MKKFNLSQYHTISKWFLRIFAIMTLVFCIIMIPLFISMHSNFVELQTEKQEQLLNSCTSELSATIAGILTISNSLRSDSDFNKLLNKNMDWQTLNITTQNQMLKTFSL